LGIWALSEQPKPAAEQSGPVSEPPRFLSAASQKVYDTKVKPFLKAHCVECHDDKKTAASFRIDTLGTDFLADKTGDDWKEVYDNISLGKMPKKKKLTAKEIEDANVVTEWIAQERRNAENRAKKSGRVRMRRLTRAEYANSIRDLFYLDEHVVRDLEEEELQPDSTFAGFDRSAVSLYIDPALLRKYIELAGKVLDQEVFGPKPNTRTVRALARDMKWAKNHNMEVVEMETLPQYRQDFFAKQDRVATPTGATIYKLTNGGIEYLAGGDEHIHIGRHGAYSPWNSNAGGGSWADNVYGFLYPLLSKPQTGLYRFKFRAGAFQGKGKYAVDDVIMTFKFGRDLTNLDRLTMTIDAPLDKPKDYEFNILLHGRDVSARNPNHISLTWNGVLTRGSPSGGHNPEIGVVLTNPELTRLNTDIFASCSRLSQEIGRATAKGDMAKAKELTEELNKHVAQRHAEYRQLVLAFAAAKKPAFIYNPDIDLDSIPRLWLESWEVEGPIAEWPSKGRKKLFFDGEERPIDEKYIREILAHFLPRAYRRAVEASEIDDWVAWVLEVQKEDKLSGLEAVKHGVKAILCSPGFLLIQEPTGDADMPRPLNDYELASRLSYFLWSSMPDDELLQFAAAKRLREPAILEAQVRRLLADPKGTEFVRNFTGQWLKVRQFGKTIINRNHYKSYTDELKKSSWQEPYEFFKEILRNDLSMLNFVDSDFLVIDKTLAQHYGIQGVQESDGFKKVAIRPEDHRGGVLGMAGVLAYLTDGFRTLPVRRGAYVLDTLWNEPPKPPPPSAGDLPTVNGKNLTVRDRLQQHRGNLICASCHAKVDPFGIALENYDAIGAWRQRQNGEGFRGDDKSPLLDVTGELPSKEGQTGGRKFSNLKEYKQALLAEKDRFVHGFTEKMLTYALGRPISRATDRETIAEIVRKLERDDYRMQSLVKAIVASEAFRMK